MTDRPALSPDAARTLAAVLDEIVPPRPDGRLPGAGALGLVADIERAMRETPDLAPAVEEGLAALTEGARAAAAQAFADLPRDDRRRLLNQVAARLPAFLPGLIFHTYVGYYQHDRVLETLGLEARPPHPLGYALERGDFGPLERVRRRGRLYRDV